MNKIKIYFFKDWVYIAPYWAIALNPLNEASNPVNHDIAVNTVGGFINPKLEYLSVCKADEARVVAKMLDMAATISENKLTFEQVSGVDLVRSTFPDADVYIVEDTNANQD